MTIDGRKSAESEPPGGERRSLEGTLHLSPNYTGAQEDQATFAGTLDGKRVALDLRIEKRRLWTQGFILICLRTALGERRWVCGKRSGAYTTLRRTPTDQIKELLERRGTDSPVISWAGPARIAVEMRSESSDTPTRLDAGPIRELIRKLEQERAWAPDGIEVAGKAGGDAAITTSLSSTRAWLLRVATALGWLLVGAVCGAAAHAWHTQARNASLTDYEPAGHDIFSDTEWKRHDYYDAPFRLEDAQSDEVKIQNHRKRYEAGVRHRYLFTDCRAYERARTLWTKLRRKITPGRISADNPEVRILPGGVGAHYFLYHDGSGERQDSPILYSHPFIADGRPTKVLRVHDDRIAAELARRFNEAWNREVTGVDGETAKARPIDWTRECWDAKAPSQWHCGCATMAADGSCCEAR